MSTLKVNNITDLGDDAVVTDGVVVSVPSHNAIINGDFGVSQRGTSFANPGNNDYTLDRWNVGVAGGSPTDVTVSRQAFTPADVEAVGYGAGEYYCEIDFTDVGTMTVFQLRQYIENVQTFAGQTVTLSFWAKGSSAIDLTVFLQQNFGSGGSSTVTESLGTQTLTTGWTRYSFTVDLDSLSGKTVGSGSYVSVRFDFVETNGNVYDIWGVQLEAAPAATPFRLAGGGAKGAELALCSRYYLRITGEGTGHRLAPAGYNENGTTTYTMIMGPQPFRATPSVSHQNVVIRYSGASIVAIGSITPQFANNNFTNFFVNAASNVLPTGGTSQLRTPNSGDYIELDCEL